MVPARRATTLARNASLRQLVYSCLQSGWSPQQVSGRLALEAGRGMQRPEQADDPRNSRPLGGGPDALRHWEWGWRQSVTFDNATKAASTRLLTPAEIWCCQKGTTFRTPNDEIR